ncbi:MAG: TIGR03862 family flavoprotein [Saccharospirillaceae bacterium]|nr:TIGR03862 family flavoprotein [Saccharospirillaceae bacterium]MCD8532752.1 TIGR03862 family flavoprotein [Saccharospirillaceae bacterium]
MPTCYSSAAPRIAVIGAGPAGLMAAERIGQHGLTVEVFDAMPSVARKFLLAGVGGMNITHAENYPDFVSRYGNASVWLKPMLDDFSPDDLRRWIHNLGIETFVGTSDRVFPRDMKAAPLLRAWLHRLRSQGVSIHPRHRWLGWQTDEGNRYWRFSTPEGEKTEHFDAVVLALGGASWPRLGSDGEWCEPLRQQGVGVSPLLPSNCGFDMPWSSFIREHFAGTPLKNIALSLTDLSGRTWSRKGECIISHYGVEGSLIYALSAPLRDLMLHGNPDKPARLWLDWLPQNSHAQIISKLQPSRKGMSFANVLRKKLNLPGITSALLKECCPQLDLHNHSAVADALKAMPLPCPDATRPIAEAISTAGGVTQASVNEHLMLRTLPGVFVAGEMLDWEAPTGGYLLTACFASGKRAGDGVSEWVLDTIVRKGD